MSKNSGSSSAKDWRSVINFFAFVAIVMIGICLVLTKLNFAASIAGALSLIANTIAYIIVAIGGWFYIANKRNVWLYVAYFVSIALIIVCTCISL